MDAMTRSIGVTLSDAVGGINLGACLQIIATTIAALAAFARVAPGGSL
jgi:hypothetical protein